MNLKKYQQIGLSVLSALLLISIFPVLDLEFLAWVTFVPLFFAIKDSRPTRAFWLGYLSGVIGFTGILYWITHAITHYGKLPAAVGFLAWPLAVIALSSLVAILALFTGTFTLLTRWLHLRLRLPFVLTAPFLWVTLEYVRSFFLSGFPWASLGYSQYLNLPLIQIAELTGVYGISFEIILVNAALCQFINGFLSLPRKLHLIESIVAGGCLLLTVSFGSWRLQELNTILPIFPRLRVGLTQGNIEQDQKWNEHSREETINIYESLTRDAAKTGVDLVIWPETAAPFYFQANERYRPRILNTATENKTYLLFGSPGYRYKDRKMRYFNSAFLVSPGGKVLGQYDKIHLVPFGEYVPIPLKWFLPIIKRWVEGIGGFSAGKEETILAIPKARFGVLICYEIIFPALARKFVKKGANFLVTITNDAWFGRTSAPYQHLSMVTLRAVENRTGIARAANTGITALIEPTGKISSATKIFTRDWLTGEVKVRVKQTFYTRFGDIFAWLCTLVSTVFIVMALFKRKK
ncbi:MAG: apolipoprotein N-acyltransferase [Deltaproteobacteria bacterium]|nr:MAG: apolipoprotein N-acyltransferase [Deltaproteobacteria bacterium]